MSYIRTKKIGNQYYLYAVKGSRVNGKVKQKHLKYFGNANNPGNKERAAEFLKGVSG